MGTMTLSPILPTLSLLALAAWAPASALRAAESAPAAAPAAQQAPGKVAQALAQLPTFNGRPAADAQYYIYLQSASWCGPCCAEMPEIARLYPEMRKAKVELILIGCDASPEADLAFLQKYHAAFPGVHYQEEALSTLPGYTPAQGIPDATFVDREGKVILRSHGSAIKYWRRIIDKYEAELTQPTPEAP